VRKHLHKELVLFDEIKIVLIAIRLLRVFVLAL
jgi:hypothetical protein